MKPFLAFLALEASSMRLRTSARLRSISACLAFLACKSKHKNNRSQHRAIALFPHPSWTKSTPEHRDGYEYGHGYGYGYGHTRTQVYLLGLHFGIVGILGRTGGRGGSSSSRRLAIGSRCRSWLGGRCCWCRSRRFGRSRCRCRSRSRSCCLFL